MQGNESVLAVVYVKRQLRPFPSAPPIPGSVGQHVVVLFAGSAVVVAVRKHQQVVPVGHARAPGFEQALFGIAGIVDHLAREARNTRQSQDRVQLQACRQRGGFNGPGRDANLFQQRHAHTSGRRMQGVRLSRSPNGT